MLLKVYEVAGVYEEALRVLECFHVKSVLMLFWEACFVVVLLKALFSACFLRLYVCDVVLSRLVALRLLHSVHCLWGGF